MKQSIMCAAVVMVTVAWLLFNNTQQAWAAPVEQPADSMGGITEYHLDNGMKVVLFPDRTKPVVSVNVTYLVGSRHEGYGESGMAHLLEHLMFKGSQKHPNIPKELSEHGGHSNASTWYDRTNYFMVLPAGEENLRWAFDLEADRMIHSFIAKKDLDSEMTVVRNEFEAGENEPLHILEERMLSTAYLWHNYGKATIGSRSDIENVPIENLQAFYRKYYQPDNAVLVVAGNFDAAKVLELAKQTFGKIAKPQRALEKTYTQEPPQDGERTVTLNRVGAVQAVGAVYHIPAAAHPDTAPLSVLAEILGNDPAGRLHKSLIESGKAVDLRVGNYELHDPGVFVVQASARLEQDGEVLKRDLFAGLEELRQQPPTTEEVEHAKAVILNGMEDALNSPQMLGITLSEYIASGDWRLFFLQRERLRQVTPADVQRVAAQYLVAENRTVGVFKPTTEPVRVAVPKADGWQAELSLLQQKQEVAAGEEFDFSPANIDARTQIVTLREGVQAAFLPKQTRGGMVYLSLRMRLGNPEALAGRQLAGRAAAELLLAGTATHNKQEIDALLTKWRAKLDVQGDHTGVRVRLSVPAENVQPALSMITEILRQPAFPAEEFTRWQQEHLYQLDTAQQSPEALAFHVAARHFSPYPATDARYVMAMSEEKQATAALTREQVTAFYRDFYGPSSLQVAMVGQFEAATVKDQLMAEWQDWTPAAAYAQVTRSYQDIPPVRLTEAVKEKENAVFVAALPVQMKREDPDYAALYVTNYLLGGGFMDSRLATRIRQQEGLSYGVQSELSVERGQDGGMMFVYAISAPQNTAKVEKAFREEIARALRDGFTEEEVRKAKQGILQAMKLSRSGESALAGTLRDHLYWQRTFADVAALERKVSELTRADLQRVLTRYVVPEKFTIITAGDFSKVTE